MQAKRADKPHGPRKPEGTHVQAGAAGPARWHHKVLRLALRAIFRLFFRVYVYGLRNVPSTPAIVCANHLGWADAFLVLLFLPIEPRIYILGERQVKHISAFRGFMIEWLQVMVALDRDKPREALAIMEDVLQRGGSLLIFPEGHLGKQEGTILKLEHGAAHLSQLSGAPLLPAGLTGTSELWLRRRLTVRIGKPIHPHEFEGDTRECARAMTARLDEEMRALLPGDTERPRVKLLRKWLTNLF